MTDPNQSPAQTAPRIAVVYYSATGSVYALAEALAHGAQQAGAEVRLRRVAELAPAEVVDARPPWRKHLAATRDVPEASHDDLRWAHGFAFGTPTRYGNVSAQLKQFLDTTGSVWAAGELADKTATAFASAQNVHGGNEATILALYVSMAHWGAIIVPPGYTDDAFAAAGGNPYGTSYPAGSHHQPDEAALASARAQGRRLARVTARLLAPR